MYVLLSFRDFSILLPHLAFVSNLSQHDRSNEYPLVRIYNISEYNDSMKPYTDGKRSLATRSDRVIIVVRSEIYISPSSLVTA